LAIVAPHRRHDSSINAFLFERKGPKDAKPQRRFEDRKPFAQEKGAFEQEETEKTEN
jgi:hypothetical protein